MELDVGLDLHFRVLEKELSGVRHRLEQWSVPFWHSLGSIVGSPAVAGGPLIFNLGGPPQGYYWRVRTIQVVAAIGALGTPVYAGNTVCDVYVASQPAPAPGSFGVLLGQVPSPADWYLSNLTTSTNPTSAITPWERPLGSEEMTIDSGDSLFIVLTGTGILTTVSYIAGAFAHQYQGFSGMRKGSG